MSTAMAKTINNLNCNTELVEVEANGLGIFIIHIPAAFPKLAKKARFFPNIRAI